LNQDAQYAFILAERYFPFTMTGTDSTDAHRSDSAIIANTLGQRLRQPQITFVNYTQHGIQDQHSKGAPGDHLLVRKEASIQKAMTEHRPTTMSIE
jgi:hypothetical protein